MPILHDAVHTLDSRVFIGDTPHLAPAHIRIESVHETGGTSGGQSTLVLHRGQNGELALGAGSIVAQADFAALSWDASRNDGGHFLFRALDQNQIDIVGSQPIRVNLQEQPPNPPAYAGYNVDLRVGHGQILTFERSMFVGSDEKLAPSAVWIHSLVENGDTAAEQPALMIDRGLASARPVTLVQGSMVLSAAEFDRLSWDTSTNNGGSFVFEALDKHNKLIPNGRPQTVTVTESPPPPSYPEQAPQVGVANQGSKLLDASLFTGSDQNRKPAAIRITAITPDSPTAGGHALTLDPDGNGSQPASAVRVDQVIALADLGKLSWNAAHNSGGRFSFVALDSSNQPIIGSPEQHVNVHESPVAPTYAQPTEAAMNKHVVHNSNATFTSSTLGGVKPDHYPAYVRITSINERNDTASGSSPLSINPPRGSSGTAPRPVTVDTEIPRSDFHLLVWDTTHNQGGNFQFIALDSQRRPIEGAMPQTVTINESPPAPIYGSNQPILSVGHDHVRSFARQLFAGVDSSREPAQIQITQINPQGGSSGRNLYLSLGQGTNRLLQAGDRVKLADLDKIHWDAKNNEGGQFTFSAQDSQGSTILGARPVTVRIEEGPSYNPSAQALTTAHDQVLHVGASIFRGESSRQTPASVRITAIDQPNDKDGPQSALYVDHGGGRITRLEVGSTLRQADFDKVRWATDTTDGGSFSFQAQDSANQAMADTPIRTVTIQEELPPNIPAPPPPQSTPDAPVAGHNRTTFLDKAVFIGTSPDASTNGRFFKITNISAYEHENGIRQLNWHENIPNQPPTAYELVRFSGAGIDRFQAEARASAAGGKLLELNEHGWYESYGSLRESVWLLHALFSPNGTSESSVLHKHSASHQRLNSYVIEYENYQHPLRLHPDENDLSVSEEVHEGQIVGEHQLSRLSWNTMQNNGGKLIFVEVAGRADAQPTDPGNQEIGSRRTVTITEAGQANLGSPTPTTRSLSGRPLSATALLSEDGPSQDSTQPASTSSSAPKSAPYPAMLAGWRPVLPPSFLDEQALSPSLLI